MRHSTIRSIAFAGASNTILFPSSPKRVGFLVFPSTQTLQLTTNNFIPSATLGWNLASTSSPFLLLKSDVGDIVNQGWSVRSAGATTIIVVEIFEEDTK